MNRKRMLAALLAAPFALGACGGGGGGGGGGDAGEPSVGASQDTYSGSTDDTSIDTSNSDKVASGAVESTTDVGSAQTSSLTLSSTAAGVKAAANAPGGAGEASGLAGRAMEILADLKSSRDALVAGVKTQELDVTEGNCPGGGSATATWGDVDEDGEFNAGDYVEFSATDCVNDKGETRNGSMAFVFHSSMEDLTNMDWEFRYGEFSVNSDTEELYADGSMRIQWGSAAGTMPSGHGGTVSGKSAVGKLVINLDIKNTAAGVDARVQNAEMAMTDGDGGGLMDTLPYYLAYHGTDADDSNNTYKMCNDDIGGCVVVDHTGTTNFKWANNTDYPDTGLLKLVGNNGSSLTLDADTNNTATVNVSVNGGSPNEKDWSTLSDESLKTLF